MTSQHAWRRQQFVVASCLAVFSLADGKNLMAQEQERAAEEASYNYTAAGKRDPFSPPFSTTAPDTDVLAEPKTPLQRFDLGQLKLVGIIWETDEPRALIEDSGGLGYIVTRGTLVGSRGGVVKIIEPKRILIEEYQTDFFGKRQMQERELRLIVTESSGEDKKKEKR